MEQERWCRECSSEVSLVSSPQLGRDQRVPQKESSASNPPNHRLSSPSRPPLLFPPPKSALKTSPLFLDGFDNLQAFSLLTYFPPNLV